MKNAEKRNLLPQLGLFKMLQLAWALLLISSFAEGIGSGSWRWRPRQTTPEFSLVKVYLFNVTNPQETINGSVPILSELGPYVYGEKRVRFNISTTSMNTVKYQENKTYEFLPDLSTGTEDDILNFVNIPFISAVAQLQGIPFMGGGLIETLLKYDEKIVRTNLRVGDLLYDGIDVHMYLEILKTLGQTAPPQMAGGRFGLFKGKNGTDEGQLEVQESPDYLHNIGDVVSWKNLTVLTNWLKSRCNKINGTDGTVFHPDIKTDTVLQFYNPELCRSLDLVYEKDQDINSVPGYKFIFPKYLLEDPEVNEDNECFCKDFDDFDRDFSVCLKKGVLDLASCRDGAPLASSFPHFLDADSIYTDKVKGLNPQRDLHQSFIVVEPKTGSVLSSSIKFQLNVRMAPLSNVGALRHIPDYLFPAMWIDKSFTLDDEASAKLNTEKDEDNILEKLEKPVEAENDDGVKSMNSGHETGKGGHGIQSNSNVNHGNIGVSYPSTSFLIALFTLTVWFL